MLIIPAINCQDYETAISRIKLADKFLHRNYRWIHIDIVDGQFAPTETWGSPEELKKICSQFHDIKFEIHLMVENPSAVAEEWLKAGAKRLIVHIESPGDPEKVRLIAHQYGAEAVLSGGPGVTAEKLHEVGRHFGFLQVLTVNPGFAGQKFGEDAFNKISFLRSKLPNVKLEIDGGINDKTAMPARKAGADCAVSASYIFGADNPAQAYEELRNA